jgi:hypothetical protein
MSTTYIFGAGASFHAKYPLCASMGKRLLEFMLQYVLVPLIVPLSLQRPRVGDSGRTSGIYFILTCPVLCKIAVALFSV